MPSTTEAPPAQASQGRRSRPNTTSSQHVSPTYGYHNTFHTHAQLPQGLPPSYARANDPKTLRCLEERARSEAKVATNATLPPSYTCSVQLSSAMGMKQELSSPFSVASNRAWFEAYVILQGTRLSIHRAKQPGLLSKNRNLTAGRFLRSYSLQHAEVGIASDFKKTALIPKSPFAHLVPAAARHKLYETDPHLFEPIREHAIRLRLETEQFLLCAPDAEVMLDWLESLCAAIDISAPIEDRSEPRYRSLPRRSRRQRLLESSGISGENIDNLSSLEAGRRIIAQQEEIIRQLYPHLAASREPGSTVASGGPETTDPELDEFDSEDVRFPTSRSERLSLQDGDRLEGSASSSAASADRKNSDCEAPTSSQALRYRRRCAPVLLASSPRVSDVVYTDGKRMRISVREHRLVEYTSHPPRYDAHGFPKHKRPARIIAAREPVEAATKTQPTAAHEPTRPGSPIRGSSDDSIASITFGEDLAPSASQSVDDITASAPPSPTGISQVKSDASRRLAAIGKGGASEESRGTEPRLSEFTVGVSLLV